MHPSCYSFFSSDVVTRLIEAISDRGNILGNWLRFCNDEVCEVNFFQCILKLREFGTIMHIMTKLRTNCVHIISVQYFCLGSTISQRGGN